ncbi:MAG: bifunctional phosphoribosylaminoimidazolecarboxamide formyltransferase/IMP cyclohydrolase [Deltaproteobacteria bacterium]|nr:bifunctional phosphoribosylaminoimidazolecarboxamide formyltransferase/IMP cyclohydrolase [Deltaproteobacteria bacterium]
MAKIERALVSVSDKTGLVEFARALARFGVELLSTGGTAKLLREAGLAVVQVSDYTGQPEILDGRVKTLHPKVHGGLLAIRDSAEHRRQLAAQGFGTIDLVVVNLYPFEATIARPEATFTEAIENIDIGGPAMIRSAAKNHAFVTVIVDPADYARVLDEMRASGGAVSAATNRELAKKVFRTTAHYDGAIADYLGGLDREGKRVRFGETLHVELVKAQDLRYGENPHQEAAFYREAGDLGPEPSVAKARQLQGKELSFNNIVDANAALELVKEFRETVAVAIKHTNPCGVATSRQSLVDAFRKCRACDPVSIFGGIVGTNREVDGETAEQMKDIFLEIVIAPSFSAEAKRILAAKKNVRLLEVAFADYRPHGLDMKKVVGGMLVQDRDLGAVDVRACKVVSKRPPSEGELRALDFAWKVCKHAKSNTIVLAREDQVVGVGAGQMSRVDSARLAVLRAETNKLSTRGTVVASDAFFPFPDALEVCAEAGATAVAHPGGSIRDPEVVDAADRRGMAMVLTGLRHFRH